MIDDILSEPFDFDKEEKDKLTGRGIYDPREDDIINEDSEEEDDE